MQVEEVKWKKEVLGIDLVAETEADGAILKRFWVGGAKVNGYTQRGSRSTLQLTFGDLVEG